MLQADLPTLIRLLQRNPGLLPAILQLKEVQEALASFFEPVEEADLRRWYIDHGMPQQYAEKFSKFKIRPGELKCFTLRYITEWVGYGDANGIFNLIQSWDISIADRNIPESELGHWFQSEAVEFCDRRLATQVANKLAQHGLDPEWLIRNQPKALVAWGGFGPISLEVLARLFEKWRTMF